MCYAEYLRCFFGGGMRRYLDGSSVWRLGDLAKISQDKKTSSGLSDPAQWVDRHGDVLYRFALRRVQKVEAAEELVQETMLAALGAMSSFEGRSGEQTWLVGILRRKIVDYIRRETRAARATDDSPPPAGEGSTSETVERPEFFNKKGSWNKKPDEWTARPDELLENVEFRATFDHCVAALPQTLASAFVLREFESMKSEEICKILQLSPTNLWTQLYRARLLLRRCVEKNWFQREP